MATTVYSVGGAFATSDPEIAETYSDMGFIVTAETRGEADR